MNRAIIRERRALLVPAGVLAAALVGVALAMIVVAAVLMYRVDGSGLPTITFVMGGYLGSPFEFTTFMPLPNDGTLPIPTL